MPVRIALTWLHSAYNLRLQRWPQLIFFLPKTAIKNKKNCWTTSNLKDRFCTKRIDSNRESESPRSHANKTGFIKYWRYPFLTRTSDMLSVGAPKWRIQGRTRAWEGIGPHIIPEYATHCEYMYVARLFLIAGLSRYSCTHFGMHRFNS